MKDNSNKPVAIYVMFLFLFLLPTAVLITKNKKQETQTRVVNTEVASLPSPTVAPEKLDGAKKLTEEEVAGLFGEKYKRPAKDFTIQIGRDLGNFAQGSINIKGEMGGALWFAAKTKSGWKLVHDGQGPIDCTLANGYSFPTTLIPSCLDAGKKLIQR